MHAIIASDFGWDFFFWLAFYAYGSLAGLLVPLLLLGISTLGYDRIWRKRWRLCAGFAFGLWLVAAYCGMRLSPGAH